MIKNRISKILPHLVAILIFLSLNCLYFFPQLQGKVVQSGDIVSFKGMTKELIDERKKTGETVMWTNAMFGGMPAFALSTPRKGNKVDILDRVFQLFQARPIGYFNALMIGFYLMLVLLGVSPWIGVLGAVAFGFTTNHFILFEAGHMSKVSAIAFLPLILAGVMLCFKNRYFLGGIIFSLGMALNLDANHPQMTYYFGLVLIPLVLIEAVHMLRNGKGRELLKIVGVLGAGLILALGCSSSLLLSTYQHSKQTMRGKPVLEKPEDKVATSSSQVDGLEWNYAMNWSNGAKDLLTAIIPGAVGGASARKISQNSAFAGEVRKLGSRTDQSPMYWGGLPSTAGPIYYGSVMMLLFFLALLVVKGRLKWWVLSAVILTFMISLGSNLEWFNRPLFDYLPLFNKFRAHSSILAITGLLIPFLAVLGLKNIIDEKNKAVQLKYLKIIGGSFLAILLLLGLFGTSMFDFSGSRDAAYASREGWVEALISDRKALFRGDAFRSFGFVAVACGLLFLYLKNKINKIVLIAGLGFLILLDLWSVGKRYLDNDSFVLTRVYDSQYDPRPANEQIWAAEPRGRGFYRVLDLSYDTFNSSKTSYFHNTIGGYHPAKLQRYQDIIDYHLSQGNFAVLNMLNTKYIIDQEANVQQNNGALGTAWFVESIELVETPNREIEVLSSLDPKNTAIVNGPEFGEYIEGFDPERTGSIELVDYHPHRLKYQTNSLSEQFAVFSEIWYGPDKGWETYIDGQPAEHIRANYVLRAMKVPAGQHVIEFVFKPKSYIFGERMSLVFSILFLGILGTYLGKEGYKLWKLEEKEIKIPVKSRRTTKNKIKRKK